MKEQLILIAEEEAKKNYHGDSGEGLGNLQPLLELFEGLSIPPEEFHTDWGGAFVYACLHRAGSPLPARYPDPRVGLPFYAPLAWMRYAKLPKIHRWHPATEEIAEGDIVFFAAEERLQMGIVLSTTWQEMELAMGNHHNHSAIITHDLRDGVLGFLRF